MRIEFTARTNKNYVKVNTVKFKLAGGGIVTLDRDETEYSINDGKLEMAWNGVYLWAINDVSLLNEPIYTETNDFIKLLDGCEFVEFELEDDADSDYFVELEEFRI